MLLSKTSPAGCLLPMSFLVTRSLRTTKIGYWTVKRPLDAAQAEAGEGNCLVVAGRAKSGSVAPDTGKLSGAKLKQRRTHPGAGCDSRPSVH
jgi:hypothetical protein